VRTRGGSVRAMLLLLPTCSELTRAAAIAVLIGATVLPAVAGAAGATSAPAATPPVLLAPATELPGPAAKTPAGQPATAAAEPLGNPALFQAMREFDLRFIPLLVAVAGTNAESARAASRDVLAAWPGFCERCTNACPDDPRLNSSLATSGEQLKAADASVASGGLANAREPLQAVRTTLMEVRARYAVEYLPDHLTRYAHPLESALAVAAKLTSTNATRDDFLKIRDLCVAFRTYWLQFVGGPRPDLAAYGFTQPQAAELQAAVEEANAALKRLETAFDAGQPEGMLSSLNGMREPYLRVLAAFGGPPPAAPPGR
jgi:hypothetical protein